MRGVLILAGLAVWPPAAQTQQQWDVYPQPQIVLRDGLLPNSPVLIKALGDAAEHVMRRQPPASAAEWKRRREEVAAAFRHAIGLDRLPERTPLNPRIVKRTEMDGYAIENLVFESRPNFPVTANLYLPGSPASGKRPAILAPIGHYLGPGKTIGEVQARCIQLARMGFIVLVYDAIGQGERMLQGNVHHEAGYALLHIGETIAGWMVWDSMRAIDYLVSRPDVDAQRIGVTGNSGGGLNTLFTAALDERVQAAAVVGFTFDFNNWVKYAGSHCTCTHLPGWLRDMEWFEVAGLIAPRRLLMLNGEYDTIFPIEGARRAARKTAAIYEVLRQPGRVTFGEIAGQPHAYSRPYREAMYGWMAQQLLQQGGGQPIDEPDVKPLPDYDARLLCDPQRAWMPKSATVIELAASKAGAQPGDSAALPNWIAGLIAPPDLQPHLMSPRTVSKGPPVEKVSFLSEEGQYIPGLLWPSPGGRGTVVIVNSNGKQATAEAGLALSLADNGYTVLAADLRGRGETLGQMTPRSNTNFRLVATQVLMGRPLAGRRAFDLLRTIDYLERRKTPGPVTVIGVGDDALPALLAAAGDRRIANLVIARYFSSFAAQMKAGKPRELPRAWNDPQLRGSIDTGAYEVDFGSAIPGVLRHGDLPRIAALLAPRRLLFCEARDGSGGLPAAPHVTSAAAEPLTADLVRRWLAARR